MLFGVSVADAKGVCLVGILILFLVAATPVSAQEAPCAFVRDLSIGAQGEDVACLQRGLIEQKFPLLAGATGYFGAQTQAAVAAWQVLKGISPAAGYFGAESRAAWSAAAPTPGQAAPPTEPEGSDYLFSRTQIRAILSLLSAFGVPEKAVHSVKETLPPRTTTRGGSGSSVAESNDLPVANDDQDEVGEGESTTGNVITGVDSDSDPNQLAADAPGADEPSTISSLTHDGVVYTAADADGSGLLTVTTALNGTLLLNLTGADVGDYTYTAPTGLETDQSEAFVYVLRDSNGDTDEATLTITVIRANEAPTDISFTGNTGVPTGTSSGGGVVHWEWSGEDIALFTASSTDADSASFTYSINGTPTENATNDPVFSFISDAAVADMAIVSEHATQPTAVTVTFSITSDDGGDGRTESVVLYLGSPDFTTGSDSFAAASANDHVIYGFAGNDTLQGGAGNDWVAGAAGADSLVGGSGTDTLVGGSSNDTLTGSSGNDSLEGGSGSDDFSFSSAAEGLDSISDFALGDEILIDRSGFGITAISSDGALTGGNAALYSEGSDIADASADSRFFFDSDSADATLYFDTDSGAGRTWVALAELTNGYDLAGSEIRLHTPVI